jgi:hypothetical protein
MNTPSIIKPRYRILWYDTVKIKNKIITAEELHAIDQRSVDHFMSFASNTWAYRAADERWVEDNTDWTGLGDTCLAIIKCVQDWPGEYLTPSEIAKLTGIFSLRNPNNLSARWMAIRRAHKESFHEPHFFLSKRTGGLGVAWDATRSWMRVSRIKPDSSDTCVSDSAGDSNQPGRA